MANNPQALKLIRSVGETPGFVTEVLGDGSLKLVRSAVPEHNLKLASVKVSPRAQNRQYENALTRLRKIGWTQELFDTCAELAREHRLADTNPAKDQLKALLASCAEHDPDYQPPKPADEGSADTGHGKVKRHSKTTPGATAKVKAQPAAPAPLGEPGVPAEVVPLPNAPKMKAEIITPERALDLLVNIAPYQRQVRDAKVHDYSAAMTRREWTLNPGDPICIDTNGKTANGQHRLRAILECELPQPFYVAYGVSPEAYRVMDRGAKRTTADMLHGAGEKNTAYLSSTATFAHLWFNVEQEEWKTAPAVTEAQVFALLEAHPNLRESVAKGRLGGGLKVSPTSSMLAHYLISRKMGGDTRLVTAWYRAIATMDLPLGQPGHSLGLYFLKSTPASLRRTEIKKRSKRELDLYLLIQAWNNTCQGKEQRGVSWKSDFVISRPLEPGERHGFDKEKFGDLI